MRPTDKKYCAIVKLQERYLWKCYCDYPNRIKFIRKGTKCNGIIDINIEKNKILVYNKYTNFLFEKVEIREISLGEWYLINVIADSQRRINEAKKHKKIY